jgi:ubiquitin-protein ligase
MTVLCGTKLSVNLDAHALFCWNIPIIFFCLWVGRAAAMTLRTVLLSLQALLAAAEPDDPQDAVVAQQYKEHYEIFRRTAVHWTSVFANGLYSQMTQRHQFAYHFFL